MADLPPEPGRLRLRISTEHELLQAADYYHDGVFDPTAAVYERDASLFILVLWREIERVENGLARRRLWASATAWARCRFTFRNCREANVVVHDPGVWPSLNLIAYDSTTGEVRFVIDGPMGILLRVDSLDATLEDTGEIASEPEG